MKIMLLTCYALSWFNSRWIFHILSSHAQWLLIFIRHEVKSNACRNTSLYGEYCILSGNKQIFAHVPEWTTGCHCDPPPLMNLYLFEGKMSD